MKSLKQTILQSFVHNNSDNDSYLRYKIARKYKRGRTDIYYADGDDTIKNILKILNNISDNKFNTRDFKLNDDGTIDVYKDLKLTNDLTELPEDIQFNKVKGNFTIGASIKTLRGCPKEVDGDLNFYVGKRTRPDWTEETYACYDLTSLEGAPQKVSGSFNCVHCKNLTSLKGAPQEVGGDFYCNKCDKLKTLEGAPRKVSGSFNCKSCNSLKSIKGAPQKVGGDFDCSYCENLTSLDYAPQKVSGSFNCSGCGKRFTADDVLDVCDVKGEVYC